MLLCPKLRILLTSSPIVGQTRGRTEGPFGFLFNIAANHGFKMIQVEDSWQLWHEPTGRTYLVHDADNQGEECPTCRVVKNLHEHRDNLRSHLP